MKKVINPQPIIDKLSFRCLTAKGVECSILGEVFDMLHVAPDPDRKLYKELCYRLGVVPTADPEEGV